MTNPSNGPFARMAHLVALLMAKPRTVPSLTALMDAERQSISDMLHALKAEGLVRQDRNAKPQWGGGRLPDTWIWVGNGK